MNREGIILRLALYGGIVLGIGVLYLVYTGSKGQKSPPKELTPAQKTSVVAALRTHLGRDKAHIEITYAWPIKRIVGYEFGWKNKPYPMTRVLYRIQEPDGQWVRRDALCTSEGGPDSIASDLVEDRKSHEKHDSYFPCGKCEFGLGTQ